MKMRKCLLATVAVLALVGTASARPQLTTPSIGWIDVSDITCEPTSDHICVVKNPAPAFTYTDPATTIRLNENDVDADQRRKYQVISGTELIILNDQGNDLFYHPEEAKGRVEVAIVIPSDWDERPGHEGKLRPDKNCHLKTTSGAIDGSMSSDTPFVSLSCKR
jgi:hypothetical protein